MTMNSLLLLPLLLVSQAEVASPDAGAPTRRGPYQLAICLRIADEPRLSPQFAEGVRRQVRDQLRNFFGPLANVQVHTSGHWLVDDYVHEDVELPFLDPEIMESRGLTEQAFVFRIGYSRNHYRVRWRTVDGTRGTVGTIREKSTADRQWVAKTICLAVRAGFAVRAEVTPSANGENVKVSFVGREHREHMTRVLGKRCCMQLYWVARNRAGVSRTVVPLTLVLWDKENGVHAGSVVSTYGSPWSRKAGITYEAVRLPTQPGRLRLRLIDKERSTPIRSGLVSLNDKGFSELAEPDIHPKTGGDGVVLSRNALQHVAFVRVHAGGTSVINVPVPITQDITDHELRIETNRDSMAKNDFVRDLRFLNQDLQTVQSVISAANQTTNDLNARKRYEEASKNVQKAVDAISPSLDAAEVSLLELKKQAEALNVRDQRPLELATTRFKELVTRRGELIEIHKTIRNAMDTRDASKRASVLVKLGEQAERDSNFDEAITRYELALGEYADQPTLSKRLAELKEEWKIKNPDHEAARQTVYERWADAEVTEISKLLPEVERAFKTLQTVGDSLTARKLLHVNTQHTIALSDLVQQLSARTSDEDKAETEKYKDLSEKMATFTETVAQFVTDGLDDPPAKTDDAPPKTEDPPKTEPEKKAPKKTKSLLDLEDA